MSDRFDFEQLMHAARAETPPLVNVTDRVMAAISEKSTRPVASFDRTLVLFAGISALAASIVAVVAWQLIEQPLVAELLNPLLVPLMASQ
jgi:hypothetical protein